MQTEGGYPQSILFKVGSQWEVPSPTVHIKNFWNTGEGGGYVPRETLYGGSEKKIWYIWGNMFSFEGGGWEL